MVMVQVTVWVTVPVTDEVTGRNLYFAVLLAEVTEEESLHYQNQVLVSPQDGQFH